MVKKTKTTKSDPSLPCPAIVPTKRHTVGRDKERAGLRAAFEGVGAGRGLLWCVAGEPGIGKRSEEGIDEMRGALDAQRAIGAEIAGPLMMGLLASGLQSLGRFVEASTVVSEALAIAERTGQHHYEPELHRLSGESLLGRARDDDVAPGTSTGAPLDSSIANEAEACFQKAVDIAQQQQAKSWELRATMSLCRLLQQQGKEEEARRMLTEIYTWFTEGFDTADLKDAKALLEELSSN